MTSTERAKGKVSQSAQGINSVNTLKQSNKSFSVKVEHDNKQNNATGLVPTLPIGDVSKDKLLQQKFSNLSASLRSEHLYKYLHCSMINFTNNCWFNATLQALSVSELVSQFLEFETASCWVSMKNIFVFLRSGNAKKLIKECSQSLITNVLEMRLPADTHSDIVHTGSLNVEIIDDCDQLHGEQIKELFPLNEMHDCREFILQVFCYVISSLKSGITVSDKIFCTKCGLTTDKPSNLYMLSLSIPKQQNNISVQNLLTKHFQEELLDDYYCDNCKNKACKKIQKIEITSHTVIIHLQRTNFNKSNKKQMKTSTPVRPDLNLVLGKNNYRLRSVIVHNGATTSCGHYYSVVIHTDGVNQYYVKCDDKSVTCSSSFPQGLESNCYILLYDRVNYSESFFNSVIIILQCLTTTKAMFYLQCNNVVSIGSRRWKIVQFCKDEKLVSEAAIMLCTKLCLSKSCILYKYSELILDVVEYLFSSNDDYITIINFKAIIFGTCSSCGNSASKVIKKTLRQFTARSVSFIFNDFRDYVMQDILSSCCMADYD